jgi:hypothetical protein
MSEKVSNVSAALVEASSILRSMASPYGGKRALQALSRKLPWSYRHIKAVWYQEDRTVVDADEMKQLRRAAKLAQEEHEATNEVAQLRERIARLENLLLATDEEFYRPTIEAISVVDRRPVRED